MSQTQNNQRLRDHENCAQWQAALADIKSGHAEFLRAYQECEANKDFAPLAPQKNKLKQAIQKIKIEKTPFNMRLRDRLCKQLKAAYISSFKDGIATAIIPVNGIRRHFYIDKQGNKIILKGDMAEGVTQAFQFHGDVALVKTGMPPLTKDFYINKKGESILPEKWKEGVVQAKDFVNGFSIFRSGIGFDDKWHYINERGEVILQGEFEGGVDDALDFSEGTALVMVAGNKRNERKYYFIDEQGRKMSEGVMKDGFLKALPFNEDVAPVQLKSKHGPKKWFYINKTGSFCVLRGVHTDGVDSASGFSNGIAYVTDIQGQRRIDKQGRDALLPPKFKNRHINPYKEDRACVNLKGEKWFFVDRNYNVVQFEGDLAGGVDEAQDFSEGVAVVKLGDKYFFVDKEGKKAVLKGEMEDGVDHALSFVDGVAAVNFNGQSHYITHEGDIVFANTDLV